VPVVTPFGAHAVYVDGRAFLPHLSNEQLPAWSLSSRSTLHSGVRSWETGNVMQGARTPHPGRGGGRTSTSYASRSRGASTARATSTTRVRP